MRICGVPFWVYDLNMGDVVRVVVSAEGAAVAEQRVQEAPNFTFRIVFEGAGVDDKRWRGLMRDVATLDCWFDIRSPAYIAMSVDGNDAQAVADLLAECERVGELRYETGRTA